MKHDASHHYFAKNELQ